MTIIGQPGASTTTASAKGEKDLAGGGGGIADLNLKYCNNNPNPTTICNDCKRFIGHVFTRGNQPSLPRHAGCLCYYVLTDEPADDFKRKI